MQLLSKDVLQDIIQYTYGTGFIDLVKITGNSKEALINAASEGTKVFVIGKLNDAVTEFDQTFGMPNLNKLKTILGFTDEYTDGSTITVNRTGGAPSSLFFQNKDTDFKNEYRLMSQALIDDRVTSRKYTGSAFTVDFVASIVGIQRLKKAAAVHSEDATFITTTSNGNFVVDMGDPATHHSNFVFHAGITGTMKDKYIWPVKEFLSIMDLPGTKKVSVSEKCLRITIDSGMAEYGYYIMALSK